MPSSKIEYQSQSVEIVPLSEEERLSGRLTLEHIGKAVAALHRDGIVVLENAVDVAHMSTINDMLCSEAEEMAKLPTTHFNDVRTVLMHGMRHWHISNVYYRTRLTATQQET